MVIGAWYSIEYTQDTDLLQQRFLAKIAACPKSLSGGILQWLFTLDLSLSACKVAVKLNLLYAFAPGLGLNGISLSPNHSIPCLRGNLDILASENRAINPWRERPFFQDAPYRQKLHLSKG